MAELGADVEALEDLARRFDREHLDLENTIIRIDAQIDDTWWQGRDAEAFRSKWESSLRRQLRNVSKELHDTQFQILRQAEQQREASGA